MIQKFRTSVKIEFFTPEKCATLSRNFLMKVLPKPDSNTKE